MSRSRMQVAVAQSDDIDTEDAVAEVIATCEAQLGGATPKAGLVFAAIDYDHRYILAALRERWPGIQLIGGTSDGELASDQGYLEDSITLVLFASESLSFSAGLARGLSEGSREAAIRAIDRAHGARSERPSMCWITPDGLTCNMTEILDGLRQRFGAELPVLGGTAGDHWEFERCFQFCNDEVVQDGIPVLLVYGELHFSVGVASGWVPVGEKMRITAAEGRTIREIDGRPAFQVFEEQFGEMVRDAFGEYPLAVYPPGQEGGEAHYLRAVYSVDEQAGTVDLTSELPEGSTVRLSNVERRRILEGARDSIAAAIDPWRGDEPDLIVIISCAARKWMLGERAPDEYATLRDTMAERGVSAPVIGFYSFGEIAPLAGENQFHNETCVSIVLRAA